MSTLRANCLTEDNLTVEEQYLFVAFKNYLLARKRTFMGEMLIIDMIIEP